MACFYNIYSECGGPGGKRLVNLIEPDPFDLADLAGLWRAGVGGVASTTAADRAVRPGHPAGQPAGQRPVAPARRPASGAAPSDYRHPAGGQSASVMPGAGAGVAGLSAASTAEHPKNSR